MNNCITNLVSGIACLTTTVSMMSLFLSAWDTWERKRCLKKKTNADTRSAKTATTRIKPLSNFLKPCGNTATNIGNKKAEGF